MVKGLSHRVVVVRPEGNRMFEQVIFIMRDDVKDPDDEDVIREACLSAEAYVKKRCGFKKSIKIPAPAFAAAGAALTGVAWLITLIK